MKTTLDDMRTFVAVVDNGHLARAAERLAQTPSAVSRAMARLESHLGATLLHRTTRRLDLTAEGQLFLEHARDILARVGQAEAAVATQRGEAAGHLRINAAPTLMQHAVVPLLAGFQQLHPQITFTLDTHDRIIDLLEHRTDIALRIGDLPDSSLVARRLGQTQLRLVASPAYLAANTRPVSPQTLTIDHCCLGFDVMTHLNRWPVAGKNADDLLVEPTLAASSASTLLSLVLAGHGIACLADYNTRRYIASGELVWVMPEHTRVRHQVIHAVYYRSAGTALRVDTLLNYLAEQMPALL